MLNEAHISEGECTRLCHLKWTVMQYEFILL